MVPCRLHVFTDISLSDFLSTYNRVDIAMGHMVSWAPVMAAANLLRRAIAKQIHLRSR